MLCDAYNISFRLVSTETFLISIKDPDIRILKDVLDVRDIQTFGGYEFQSALLGGLIQDLKILL